MIKATEVSICSACGTEIKVGQLIDVENQRHIVYPFASMAKAVVEGKVDITKW